MVDPCDVGETEPRMVDFLTSGIEDGGRGLPFVDVESTIEFSQHTALLE